MNSRLAALCALALCAAPLTAQHVRGTVLMIDSTTRASGIVVLALNDSQATVSRALTDDRGEFDLVLPVAGRYTARALRIGFTPTELSPLTIAGNEERRITIVLRGVTVSLEEISVPGKTACRIRADSGRLVSTLWTQTLAALNAAQLTAKGKTLRVAWTSFERNVLKNGFVRHDTSFAHDGYSMKTFSSISADELAVTGYITEDGDAKVYNAPDADVLLSDSFAAYHCFRAVPAPKDHPDWIGIAFGPEHNRSDIHDIAGTFWLDRKSTELRQVEYRYTSVPGEYARRKIGGIVEFLKLSTGHWIVSSWQIRMPRDAVTTEVFHNADNVRQTREVKKGV